MRVRVRHPTKDRRVTYSIDKGTNGPLGDFATEFLIDESASCNNVVVGPGGKFEYGVAESIGFGTVTVDVFLCYARFL